MVSPKSAIDETIREGCSICKSGLGKLHEAREMMLGLRGSFPYWECEACGCLSLAAVPTNLGQYYPDNYYSLQKIRKSWTRKLRSRIYLSPLSFLVNWRSRTDLDVIRRVHLKKSMSLLEVGCGSGRLLAELRELGYNCRGVDPFVASDIHDHLGLRVERKHLADVQGVFDVILFRHSLEHMPIESLELARRCLKKDGICVVCIPVIGWAWREYGPDWVQLDAPRHVFLHTRKSFETHAEQSGFRVEQVVFDSTEFQFWASESYQKDIPLCEARPPAFLKKMRMRRLAAALNRKGEGDTAQFFLRLRP